MPEVLDRPIEIFYAGNHTDSQGKKVRVTSEQLAASVADFNASGERLPMVPGHPQDDQPAGAWATKLAIVNGRAAVVEADEVNPLFRAIVNSGELNRVSVKFQLPGHHANPTGNYRFRHVGFLGRSRPALDQLQTAKFSANDGEILLMADDNDNLEAEFAEREAEFAKREAEFAAQKKAFDKAREFEPFVEGLVRTGQIPPAQKSGFVALFSALPDKQSAEFAAAEGEKQSPADFLKAHLSKLPADIIYKEVSRDDGRTGKTEVSFSSHDGNESEPTSAAMLDNIIAAGVDITDSAAFSKAMREQYKKAGK